VFIFAHGANFLRLHDVKHLPKEAQRAQLRAVHRKTQGWHRRVGVRGKGLDGGCMYDWHRHTLVLSITISGSLPRAYRKQKEKGHSTERVKREVQAWI